MRRPGYDDVISFKHDGQILQSVLICIDLIVGHAKLYRKSHDQIGRYRMGLGEKIASQFKRGCTLFTCFLCHAHWLACAIQNCMHGLPKLLVVYWLGLTLYKILGYFNHI